MNEDDARELLHATAAPVSGVDLETVVRAGRRRRTRRRVAEACGGVAVIAAVAAAVTVPAAVRDHAPATPGAADPAAVIEQAAASGASPSPVAVTCQGRELAVPSGAQGVTVTAIDPSGRYVAGWSVHGSGSLPILWTDGVPARLDVGAPSAEIGAVNRSGAAAGVASSADFATEWVFRYEHGHATKLNGLPGRWHYYPQAYLNDAGYVLVNAEPQGNSGGVGGVTLLWRPGSTTAEKLPLPTGTKNSAGIFGITDDNTIAGGTYADGAGRDAYVWDVQGHGRKLDAPQGTTAVAYAVRGDWATGGVWRAGHDGTLAVWNIRTGAVRVLPQEIGTDVNALGAAVNRTGKVFRPDGVATLPPLAKGQSVHGAFIADTGTVVGDVSSGHTSIPAIWTC